MKIKRMIVSCLGSNLKNVIQNIPDWAFDEMEEVRIRALKPLIIYKAKEEFFVSPLGNLSTTLSTAFIPSPQDLIDTLEIMSNYSLYAFEEELKNGYLTLQGGHRVGLVGKIIVEYGKVKTQRYIGGMNIRISHEIKGCANEVIPHLLYKNSIYHTLIVSPPRCGKTTLLRDLVRQISTGIPKIFHGMTVGIVDERSEIAGSYQGIPQNDVGIRTDVLDCCPKADGMSILLRSMSPGVIAVDEIGKTEELYAIEDALSAGVKIICTVHGSSLSDIQKKPVLSQLLQKQAFERIVVLSHANGPGTIDCILDGQTLKPI